MRWALVKGRPGKWVAGRVGVEQVLWISCSSILWCLCLLLWPSCVGSSHVVWSRLGQPRRNVGSAYLRSQGNRLGCPASGILSSTNGFLYYCIGTCLANEGRGRGWLWFVVSYGWCIWTLLDDRRRSRVRSLSSPNYQGKNRLGSESPPECPGLIGRPIHAGVGAGSGSGPGTNLRVAHFGLGASRP